MKLIPRMISIGPHPISAEPIAQIEFCDSSIIFDSGNDLQFVRKENEALLSDENIDVDEGPIINENNYKRIISKETIAGYQPKLYNPIKNSSILDISSIQNGSKSDFSFETTLNLLKKKIPIQGYHRNKCNKFIDNYKCSLKWLMKSKTNTIYSKCIKRENKVINMLTSNKNTKNPIKLCVKGRKSELKSKKVNVNFKNAKRILTSRKLNKRLSNKRSVKTGDLVKIKNSLEDNLLYIYT